MFHRLFAVVLLVGLSTQFTPVFAADAAMKFEIYKDKAEEFRWRLKAGNGETLATPGQGYKKIADAKKGVESVMKCGADEKMKF